MIIRARTTDLEELQNICRKAYTQHFGDHWEEGGLEMYLKDQFGEDRLSNDLDNEMIHFYFVKDGDSCIGFCKINIDMPFEKEPNSPSCELEKIYLLNEWTGKNYGKRALNFLLDIARSYDRKLIFLCVVDSNAPAIAFYLSQGFEVYKKTMLKIPLFKDDLRGMYVMYKHL